VGSSDRKVARIKLAIVTNQTPLVQGGAELLTQWLAHNLEHRGHEAQIVRIPFRWYPPDKILDHIVAARLLRLDGADRVVAMKFPAYYVRHHSKFLWLLHQFRQAYDLLGTSYEELANTAEGKRVRQAIVASDAAFLPEAERIYTNSAVTSARLLEFNGLSSEVLYPPLGEPEGFYTDGYGDYIFCPSRISAIKRQHLLVEAMAHVQSRVRLVLAGQPDSPDELEALTRSIEKHQARDKVELRAKWISEDEKRALFARALGCAYIPYDEDSYGYVTLEAYHARKPVVTCSDSGGILELVRDGETGFVVEPDPRDLAKAFDALYEDAGRAAELGQSGYRHVQTLKISWDHVVECLVA
jgi:glycosyltransferase involved in cell wall biosynthesis